MVPIFLEEKKKTETYIDCRNFTLFILSQKSKQREISDG